MTVERMANICSRDNVFIILGARYADLVLDQIPNFPRENLIFEPCARDTAAAIGLGAVIVSKRRPGSTMVVAPADHLIDEEDKFRTIVENGFSIARKTDCLLTIGIPPREPSSAYGYIEAGETISAVGNVEAWEVRGFKEKPDTQTARTYLEKGNFLWNSGIFIWRTNTILQEISHHLPQVHEMLSEIRASLGTAQAAQVLETVFPMIQKISIDYGVLEKSKDILTLKGDFFWDDLGSWNAFANYLKQDKSGNRITGKALVESSHDCLVIGDEESLVATYGVRDLIIVRARDAVLVCDRNDDQAVKKLVEKMKSMDNLKGFV